jgi:hypothetical protein
MKRYFGAAVSGGEKVERFAIGPIPAFDFHLDRYVSEAEMAQLLKDGADANQFRPGSLTDPEAPVWQYGEWLSDTFMPKLLVNEDQLFEIPDEDLEQWEKDEWVVVPYDEQWMVKS